MFEGRTSIKPKVRILDIGIDLLLKSVFRAAVFTAAFFFGLCIYFQCSFFQVFLLGCCLIIVFNLNDTHVSAILLEQRIYHSLMVLHNILFYVL